MCEQLTLSRIADAIVYAATEAQTAVEKQHQNLKELYFDQDGNPNMVSVTLPDGSSMSVPELSLIPTSSLKISQLDVDFNAVISDIHSDDDSNDIKINFGTPTDGSSSIDVKISLVSTDPPEGLVRINDEIIRLLP